MRRGEFVQRWVGGSCDLVWRFKHLHEESVYRCVSNELEEEQMLETLQAYGAQGWEPQQELGEPADYRQH